MDRFCLTDAQWAAMEPYCLGKPTDPAARAATIGCFWKECFGLPEPAALGAICRRYSAIGIRFSRAIAIGSKPVFSKIFSMQYQKIQTWNMR